MQRSFLKDKKRIVVKVGSSSLTNATTGTLDYRKLDTLVRVLSDLSNQGKNIILVTSGAQVVGKSELQLQVVPQEMPRKQALAAIGQAKLMTIYKQLFSQYNKTCAQVLLTKGTMFDEQGLTNTRNTFRELWDMNVIPIVNENDTVSTEEIEFGDNDTLSALVLSIVNGDLLVILSDIDGFYTDDPSKNATAQRIDMIEHLDAQHFAMGKTSSSSGMGTGGMHTKLKAAKIVTDKGADMVLASGADVRILYQILDGDKVGTLFLANPKPDFSLDRYIKNQTSPDPLGLKARQAALDCQTFSEDIKNQVLRSIAAALLEHKTTLLSENQKDIANTHLSAAMVDRLRLTEERLLAMKTGILQLVALSDPIGNVLESKTLANGLLVEKVTVPLGVIGIIYESRPNVTVDAFALCFKAGNAVILKGGKEAIHTNIALESLIRTVLIQHGLNPDIIQVIKKTDRQTTLKMMRMREIDVLIPRGSAQLIQTVVEHATVPVIETGAGNCHIYVDDDFDETMAINIIRNAKLQRLGVCNAAESLVLHQKQAADFLPKLIDAMPEVSFYGDDQACRCDARLLPATPSDFDTEYLDTKLSVALVDSLTAAIQHINTHSTQHSEAIITNNLEHGERFLNEVDSACVYINASTRFTDGFEMGLGAEIGISTQKLHARGPMGLRELTATKYKLRGTGQTR